MGREQLIDLTQGSPEPTKFHMYIFWPDTGVYGIKLN